MAPCGPLIMPIIMLIMLITSSSSHLITSSSWRPSLIRLRHSAATAPVCSARVSPTRNNAGVHALALLQG